MLRDLQSSISTFFPIHSLFSIDNKTFTTPGSIRKSLFSTITSSNIAFKALGTLMSKLKNDPGRFDTTLVKELNLNKRQNGLMKYNEEELFSLTLMQKHCAIISDEYRTIKVLAEGKLPERQM